MNKILGPAERRALKARAHPLKPTVMIGTDGLSASVMQEIDSTLKAHELVKIRVDQEDSDEREDLLGMICANTGASAIDHIGKILVIYRERPGGGGDKAKSGGASGSRSQAAHKANRNGGNAQPGGNGEGKRKAKAGGQVWTKVRPQRGRKGRSGAKRGPGGQGGGNSSGGGGGEA
jgi:RNA-binding protein